MDRPKQEDLIEIQNNERLVIESIYGEDATFPEKAWKVWNPLDVKIRLEALSTGQESENENKKPVGLDLRVICDNDYPYSIPRFEFSNISAVSQDCLKKLRDKLTEKAKNLKGTEMVHELCQLVREYLAEQKIVPAGSFHDKMMKEIEKNENEIMRKRADSERKEVEWAEERERIKIENQLQREVELGRQQTARIEGEFRMIAGRRVVVLANIPVKRKKLHRFCREWMGFCDNEQLLISEWTFRYTANRNLAEAEKRCFAGFLRCLDAALDELNALCELPSVDPNLVGYAFIHSQKISTSDSNFNVQVFVAQRLFPDEENLTSVYHVVATNGSLMRRLAAQAVCALRWLHEQQLSHSAVLPHAVWLRDNLFRFSDFGTLKKLTSLCEFFSTIVSGKQQAHPETEEKEKKSTPRKKDLFQLGILLDGLSIEGQESHFSRAPTPSIGNTDAATQLASFVTKCQEAKNIDQLVEDPYLIQDLPLSGSNEQSSLIGGGMDSHCRLMKEFFVIRMLGKGGFGDVLLARNKLDSSDYAVKRIPLNSGNERLNRRIKREAKLFAKLNHPHVVRYYSAWIEEIVPVERNSTSTTVTSSEASSSGAVPIPGKPKKPKLSSSSTETMTAAGNRKALKKAQLSSINEATDSLLPAHLRNLERETAAALNRSFRAVGEASEWSTSYRVCDRGSDSSSSSEDEDDAPGKVNGRRVETLFSPIGATTSSDDELDIMWESEKELSTEEFEEDEEDVDFGASSVLKSRSEHTDSVEIVFGDSKVPQNDVMSKILEESEGDVANKQGPEHIYLLFIQMEYCERGTLRQLIDTNFFVGQPMNIWRIFSEILSGLQYIHQLSMIHRDIKPMNIFLDATREFLLNRKRVADVSMSMEGDTAKKNNGSAQTRDIGTELYMAPELFDCSAKTPYTAKIDVFSAGVVLFEMFYRPLLPGMERMSTLNTLKKDLRIPEDFGRNFSNHHTEVARRLIESMLDKDPEKRPTVSNLLNDDSLPSNETEDENFKKQFAKVFKRRNGRLFSWAMDTMFSEEVFSVTNYYFDRDVCQERFQLGRDSVIEEIRSEISTVLRAHAYELLHMHTLVPAPTARAAAPVRLKPVELLDPSGLPLALPMDLRQNFVRYCARNAVNRFKRYNFGRVYSTDETRILNNTHPYERWECSVDSIGPQTSSTTLEAELLLTACQIVAATLKNVKATLKIGHINIIEAAMRHLSIPDDARSSILTSLHCMSTGDKVLSHTEKVAQLAEVVGMRNAAPLFGMLPEACKYLSKSRDENVSTTIRRVLEELEMASEILAIGMDESTRSCVEIIYDSTTCYRPTTFGDGLVFQLFVEVPRKKAGSSRQVCVLAGGRYDSLLLRERHPRDIVPALPRFMAGFAVSLDVMAQIRKIIHIDKKTSSCSALVCSFRDSLLREKFRLANMLWSRNVATDVLHEPVDSLAELIEHCDRKSISDLLVVFSAHEIFLRHNGTDLGKIDMERAVQHVTASAAIATTPGPQRGDRDEDHSNILSTPLTSSRSSSSLMPSCASATIANLNISFALTERLGFNIKKRIEASVKTHIADQLAVFGPRTRVEVIVCELIDELFKSIVFELSNNFTKQKTEMLIGQLARQHGKSKQDLEAVGSQLVHAIQHQTSLNHQIVVLYRHTDHFFRLIL
ncbi:unnamed protein product [Caenorhabditis auriculariae]|uniref:non-specific serine/threonine protein kinase n=1 Tax=Caenorhabditis auriculariae TaxID=2777116 RepID=A0A8S1HAN0_9PELO|nr:unnamed protein product [Caenorhabditis auriculariae]